MMRILFLIFTTFNYAQAGLTPIKVCGVDLKVEIMKTEEEKAKGLMNRKSLNTNQGMLFVYDDEQSMSFWMKNTYIPLSIGFFNKDKKLLEVLDMAPLNTKIIYKSKEPAQYALEVNKGWFSKKNIKPGCSFEYNY